MKSMVGLFGPTVKQKADSLKLMPYHSQQNHLANRQGIKNMNMIKFSP